MHRMPIGIASGRRSPREWIPTLVVALVLAAPATADVVVKQKIVSEGLSGFANGTVNSTLIFSGDRSRSEDEATYTGRFKTLGGKKPGTSISITRLDKDVIWSLEPGSQQYTELTFAEMRGKMEQGAKEMGKAQKEANAKDAGMIFTVDVKKTGGHQVVNGFPCEQVIITCIGKPEKPEPGAENAEVQLVLDEWLSTKVSGTAEIKDFGRKFAEKMGLDMSLAQIPPMARAMYGGGMKEMAAKFKDIEGYPIRTVLTIAPGGLSPDQQQKVDEAQKGLSAEQQQQVDEAQKAAAAAADSAQAEAKKIDTEGDKVADTKDADEIAREAASGGGVSGKLGGFLGGKFRKSAAKKAEQMSKENAAQGASSAGANPAGANPAGVNIAGAPLFKVVTEVMSVTASPAPAGSFDVPAGYKKKG